MLLSAPGFWSQNQRDGPCQEGQCSDGFTCFTSATFAILVTRHRLSWPSNLIIFKFLNSPTLMTNLGASQIPFMLALFLLWLEKGLTSSNFSLDCSSLLLLFLIFPWIELTCWLPWNKVSRFKRSSDQSKTDSTPQLTSSLEFTQAFSHFTRHRRKTLPIRPSSRIISYEERCNSPQ